MARTRILLVAVALCVVWSNAGISRSDEALERFVGEIRSKYKDLGASDRGIATGAVNYFARLGRAEIVVIGLNNPDIEVRMDAAESLARVASDENVKALAPQLANALEKHNMLMSGGSEVQTPLRRIRKSLVILLARFVGPAAGTVDENSSMQVTKLIALARAKM